MNIHNEVAVFYHDQFNRAYGEAAKTYLLEKMGLKYLVNPEKTFADNLIGCKGEPLAEAFSDRRDELQKKRILFKTWANANEPEIVAGNDGMVFPTMYDGQMYYLYAYNPSKMIQLRHRRSWGEDGYPVFKGQIVFTEGEKEAFLIRSLGFQAFPIASCRYLFSNMRIFRHHFIDCIPYFHVDGNDEVEEKYMHLCAKRLLEIDVDSKMIYSRETEMMDFLNTYKQHSAEVYHDMIASAKHPIAALF